MLRYIGAAALIASSWAIGAILANAEKDKPRALAALYGFTGYLLRHIKAERTPLRTLFNRYDDVYLEKTGFLNTLRSSGEIPTLWKNALALLPLSGTVLEEAKAFGEDLGRLPLEDQEKKLTAFNTLLAAERDNAEKGLAGRQKSIRAAATLCGMLGAIILI